MNSKYASLREEIYQEALRHGGNGAIAEELYLVLSTSQNTGTMRCSELKFTGKLVETGIKKLTKANRPATVLVADQCIMQGVFRCDDCEQAFTPKALDQIIRIEEQPYVRRLCSPCKELQ